jgi:hypothetical protein
MQPEKKSVVGYIKWGHLAVVFEKRPGETHTGLSTPARVIVEIVISNHIAWRMAAAFVLVCSS